MPKHTTAERAKKGIKIGPKGRIQKVRKAKKMNRGKAKR